MVWPLLLLDSRIWTSSVDAVHRFLLSDSRSSVRTLRATGDDARETESDEISINLNAVRKAHLLESCPQEMHSDESHPVQTASARTQHRAPT